MKNTIYVVCPAYIKTGGTELLHQLVSELLLNGHNAYITYEDPREGAEYLNDAFRKYVSEYRCIKDIEDDKNNILIIPEISTPYIKRYYNINIYVWWLSVDNYFAYNKYYTAMNQWGYFQTAKEVLKHIVFRPGVKNVAVRNMKHIAMHLTQSEYARQFLASYGITSIEMLGDYVNEVYLSEAERNDNQKKENLVIYNPSKGKLLTEKIIKYCVNENYTFVPLQGMSNEEVLATMKKAKVYIDFGHHPGKDRMPREAAIMNCCIITSTYGAAENDIDIPIDSKYKFNGKNNSFPRIKETISELICNYDIHVKEFAEYRKKILGEKLEFKMQVKNIFG